MPFTVKQFLDVFVAYNAAIWPAQFGVYVLGFGVGIFRNQPGIAGP